MDRKGKSGKVVKCAEDPLMETDLVGVMFLHVNRGFHDDECVVLIITGHVLLNVMSNVNLSELHGPERGALSCT